jgi:hypothetical protein
MNRLQVIDEARKSIDDMDQILKEQEIQAMSAVDDIIKKYAPPAVEPPPAQPPVDPKKAAEEKRIAAIPVWSAAEIEQNYQADLARAEGRTFSLGKWLPGLGRYRPVKPGELVTIVAGTSQGKSAALVSLSMVMKGMTVLIFELELPPGDIWERMVSIERGLTGEEVERAYKLGDGVNLAPFKHIWLCPLPLISPKRMFQIIQQSAEKIGRKPDVVMIDYLQLLGGSGASRYEKTADNAEQLKRIARMTDTIVIATSQRVEKRGEGDTDPEVYLHSARNASEIENSSQWILGVWKDQEDARTIHVKVIKATRGVPGLVVDANFNGATMTITEKSKTPDRA